MTLSDFSVAFSAPFDPEVWRIVSGARPCALCGTPVTLFDICEEDVEGWPISERPTGEKRWSEMTDPPGFGVEHTEQRCREVAGT